MINLNMEQAEAELVELAKTRPMITIGMPPAQWPPLVTALILASTHPNAQPNTKQGLRGMARAIAMAFPPECKQFHMIFVESMRIAAENAAKTEEGGG